MHLRPPSIAHGVQAFLWSAFFFLFIWLGAVAVRYAKGISFIVAAVAGFLIFLLVRTRGEEEPRRP